jgi:dTMP kinase
MAGGFIVYFDGPDGVGKTTQLEKAAEALRGSGRVVHITRVLGGSPIGELLTAAILSDVPRPVETDLHVAMACHYASSEDILTRRSRGEIVLIDRSPLSILAYQVAGGGLDEAVGQQAVREIFNLIQPDLAITYEASQEQLLQRLAQRGKAADYFESKSDDFQLRVVRGFQAGAIAFKAHIIDAGQSVEVIHEQTMALLTSKLSAI